MYKKHSLTAIVNPTVGIKTPELEDHMLEYGINDGTLVIKVMKNFNPCAWSDCIYSLL
eukprot:m.59830 g.59830  ORF g.59830 m.59830 type:complete len:58 (-) comp11275_c0_seq4:140-313(-)